MKFSFTSLLALQLTAVLAAQPQQKMTIAHWRKPEFTHEEFLKGFVEVYVPKLAKIMEEYHIPAMASYTGTKERSEEIKKHFPNLPDTYEYADHDLILEYIIPDLNVIDKVNADPKYQEIVDATHKYLDPKKRRITLGDYTPLVSQEHTGSFDELK